MAIRRRPNDDVEAVNWLCVAIKETDRATEQRHTGLYYKLSPTEPTQLCHLAWHFRLTNEVANDANYIWIESDLNETVKKQIVAYIDNILEAGTNTPIPYSFNDFNGSFDPNTGAFIKTAAGEGLTCATFILAIFQTMQRPLVQEATWNNRPQDIQWQARMVNLLTQHGAHPTHVTALQTSIGAIRFRPEEVAAAYNQPSDQWPITAGIAIPEGERLVIQMRAHAPLPPTATP